MFFSVATLYDERLPGIMHIKRSQAGVYASHQWLWQLFPQQEVNQPSRHFLFHEQQRQGYRQFYLLSATPPDNTHNLFDVKTKAYQPKLVVGQLFAFRLRANPVVTRNGKRNDVMMDARWQGRLQSLDAAAIHQSQQQAARQWLVNQAEKYGFAVDNQQTGISQITDYQQQVLRKKRDEGLIKFSYVDYAGVLQVTDPQKFLDCLYQGIGKSKAFGCGLMLIRPHAISE